MDYDSARVRQLARSVRSSAESIRGLSGGELRTARSSVSENLLGRTASALSGALENLSREVSQLASTLDGIASDLFDYANRLDEADRQAQQLINRQ